jgi:hypothetical protein
MWSEHFFHSLAGMSFLSLLVITEPNWDLLGVTRDAEKTQDKQRDRKWD